MKKRLAAMGLVLALALTLPLGWCLADEEGVDDPILEQEEDWDYEEWEESDEEEAFLVIPFPDVAQSAEYAEAVAYLAEAGILKGDENGRFNPNATITRAETATIICRLMGMEDEAKANRRQVYDDVPATHWASGYIAQATELGVFNGDGTGNFRPGDNVTYEQVIKMLVCACGYEDEARQSGGWPNGYIAVAAELGITNEMRFRQTANAPRSAVAQLAYNAIFAEGE